MVHFSFVHGMVKSCDCAQLIMVDLTINLLIFLDSEWPSFRFTYNVDRRRIGISCHLLSHLNKWKQWFAFLFLFESDLTWLILEREDQAELEFDPTDTGEKGSDGVRLDLTDTGERGSDGVRLDLTDTGERGSDGVRLDLTDTEKEGQMESDLTWLIWRKGVRWSQTWPDWYRRKGVRWSQTWPDWYGERGSDGVRLDLTDTGERGSDGVRLDLTDTGERGSDGVGLDLTDTGERGSDGVRPDWCRRRRVRWSWTWPDWNRRTKIRLKPCSYVLLVTGSGSRTWYCSSPDINWSGSHVGDRQL